MIILFKMDPGVSWRSVFPSKRLVVRRSNISTAGRMPVWSKVFSVMFSPYYSPELRSAWS